MQRIEGLLGRMAGLPMALSVMLVLALPGFFTIPPVDRDEALFAQASAQMLASGDLIDIRFDDQPRYRKPVGIYWLQAAAAALTGQPGAIWSYRLVSLLGALVAVGFTYGAARLVLPREGAVLAAVMLAASVLLGAEARLAKTDAVLLATITAGQYVLARAHLAGGVRLRAALGFWLALGVGVLVKGPIAPLVLGLTLAALCAVRRDLALWRALRPAAGGVVALAVVLPWLAAITLKSGGAFWGASLGADMWAKLGTGQESHGAPPGRYLLMVWATFWPGAVLLAAGAGALWRRRREPAVAFVLCWAVPMWIGFEMAATKLAHYVLPAYPALAIGLAVVLVGARPGRMALGLGALASLVPLAALAAFWMAARALGGPLGAPFWAGGAGVVLCGLWLLGALGRGAPMGMAAALAGAGLSLSVAFYPSVQRMAVLWPAVAVADLAAARPGCAVSVVGYGEPSLVFLTRRAAHIEPAAAAAARIAGAGCALAVVEAAEVAAFRALAPGAVPEGEIEGFNIGRGRQMRLQIFAQPPAQAAP